MQQHINFLPLYGARETGRQMGQIQVGVRLIVSNAFKDSLVTRIPPDLSGIPKAAAEVRLSDCVRYRVYQTLNLLVLQMAKYRSETLTDEKPVHASRPAHVPHEDSNSVFENLQVLVQISDKPLHAHEFTNSQIARFQEWDCDPTACLSVPLRRQSTGSSGSNGRRMSLSWLEEQPTYRKGRRHFSIVWHAPPTWEPANVFMLLCDG
jgi:hypothetical protein